MGSNFKRVKWGCYLSNISMAVVGNLPPLLFLTFRTQYGISYSLLGLLILVNFCTQLAVDLIFSFFSHKFNISKTLKIMPILAVAGFVLFTFSPWLFPNSIYTGLLLGTVVFSASSGLAEVLISPTIAEIPADDPDREMSKLHSVYAWGVVAVVLISTVYLYLFGIDNWQWLALIFCAIPIMSAILLGGSEIPEMQTPEHVAGAIAFLKNGAVWLCFFGIFLGGASEIVMAQWSSTYIEQVLGVPKLWGDMLGVAMFGLTLGLGRTIYAKFGKNIELILMLGGIGATLCYLTAAITSLPLLGLIACAMTGFFVSMLWPGSLIVASAKFPSGGVLIFALMAAGGDLGASIAPQLVGVICDSIAVNPDIVAFATKIGITSEQLGLKAGMLFGMVFPFLSIPVYAKLLRQRNIKEQ